MLLEISKENLLNLFMQKTIISSALTYPFNRSGSNVLSARIALGAIFGAGFSGSPVIPIREGSAVGMTVLLSTELDNIRLKIHRHCIKGDLSLEYTEGITLAIPSIHVKIILMLL